MTHSISSRITSGASLLILSGISVDRLLTLALHLRYSIVVTVPRVVKTAVCLWIVSIAVATLKFLDEQRNYHSSVDTGSGISYYNFEHLENISDRSQTSAPDNTATAECSEQHDKRGQM